ncbi:hypothetical protein CHLRE_13g584750v5 [Chlamydomonas reinhardtii]|uniref:Methyltransferase type 11 domain-containing protein n=1 Tax=Chlamydomonas reinhardtii TaxID=3055 RepID=A0A2K3D0M2_CHLRE|nr:uncharacterized protein CHLRE_13g584750v5 [Chlamydomonas reinhardtii]PNW74084.1 hypothetical protein CHLRE_13g584750v5 [Chlamydomonas reinhardtii]
MRAAPWFASCVSALGSSSSQLGAVSSSGGGGALLRALTGSPELAAAPGSSLRPVPLSHVPCASSHSSTSSSPINNISSSRSCCTDNTESANSSNSASSESAHAATPARLSATWPPLARRHRVLAPRLPAAAGAAGGALGGGAAEAEACSSGMQPAQQLPVCAAAAAATRLNGLRCCLHTSSAAAAAASAATAASASSAAAAGGGGGGSCRTGSGGGSGEGTGASGRGDRGGGGAGAGWGRGAGGGGGGGAGGSGGGGAPPREEGLGAVLEVFNKPLKALQRGRAAALQDVSDPLLGAVSGRLLDRLEDCRVRFPTAVVLGGAALPVVRQLGGGRAGIERVIVIDSSQEMLDRLQREEAEARSCPDPTAKPWPAMSYVRGDEEHLPLAPKSVDLIISCMGLHWANDLPGAMAQCRAALVPDGLFLAALLGGDTLQELRIACALAQMEREGGVSAVISPLAQVRDAGNLLTRADLRLPSVDVDAFHIGYPSPLELVQHLRALGEGNASVQRRRMLPRDSALAAAAVYQSMFGFRPDRDQEGEAEEGGSQGRDESRSKGSGATSASDDDDGGDGGGGITATYQVIFMTGWAPAPHQPKAAKRGSATVSFQDLAEGLVKGGQGVGGTAEEGVVVGAPQDDSPLPSRRKP